MTKKDEVGRMMGGDAKGFAVRSMSIEPVWQPLSSLSETFNANCAALGQRDAGAGGALAAFVPQGQYLVRNEGGAVRLGRREAGGVVEMAAPVDAEAAPAIAAKAFPGGKCGEPILVAGVGQGWLWQTLYAMPCGSGMPGHRPPLFFVARELEELWVAMHLHDWRALLSDARVQLFCGADAMQAVQRALESDLRLPWPRLALTIDPLLWPAGMNLESVRAGALGVLNEQLRRELKAVDAVDATVTMGRLTALLQSGRKLRVLGITSRYTTFLQHSMRDWLKSFEEMGHETRLCIESADHETASNLVYARECAEYRPDLILLIDHYRAEMGGLPKNVPCVMWVQDMLPNILSAKAGAAQQPRDYVIGYGREVLAERHGYPYERFMPCMVGVNEKRFGETAELSAAEQERYGCEVSFVSHASTTPEVLLQRQLTTATAETRRLLCDVYERLKAVYEAGGAIADPQGMNALVEQSLRELGMEPAAQSREAIKGLFTHQINNAFYRHQALRWVAEMGVDLRLYGNAWEQHPTLGRFARGPADNQTQLAAVYRASRINLHVTPHGAVHQRVLEGLCAGGFFLMRYRPGDAAGVHYRALHEWCRRHEISSDSEFRTRATSGVWRMLEEAQMAREWDVFDLGHSFMEELNLLADSDYTLAGATLWEEYFDVAFNSREELEAKVRRYLGDEAERQRVVSAMRRPVMEKLTYRGISQRMIDFIVADLEKQQMAESVRNAA